MNQIKSKFIESLNILVKINDQLNINKQVDIKLQNTLQEYVNQNSKLLYDLENETQNDDELDNTIAELQEEMNLEQKLNKIQNQHYEPKNQILLKSLELQDTNLIREVNEQSHQARHHTSIRGRDKSVCIPPRKKKKQMVDAYGDDQSQFTQYSSTGRQGAFGIGQSNKRGSVSSRRNKNQNDSQLRTQSPLQIRKSIKQRKNILQTNKSYQLQEVGVFKKFLLENDSQFIDYVNSDLILNLLDSQMMKENMISFMAQLMGNGQSKDNFFLKTRTAIQDTISLFFVAKNISQNNSVEFYLPRLIEMVSDLLDVERCSIYLYDRIKDELYCKVITGKMKDPLSFKRQSNNVISQVFISGEPIFVKNIANENQNENILSYLEIDHKLHQATRNFMIVPIKLGNNAVGCFEVANKKGSQEFTDHDISIIQQICEEIAGGLISYEMKYNIKKEFDEELKHVKGLMGEIYQQTLIPLLHEMQTALQNILKAEKIIIFMHNKDIDHLYSFSTQQEQNQQFNPLSSSTFGIDTIRMKSQNGLAGRAFTTQRIQTESNMQNPKHLTQDERDLQKLKLNQVNNVLSIPVLEKQNNNSQCVIQVYNYDNNMEINEQVLLSFSNFISSGTMLAQDILEAQFDLINDGVIILNSMGLITKINKSCQIMFNSQASIIVGKHISDLLSGSNNHLFSVYSEQEIISNRKQTVLNATNDRIECVSRN